jgi:hypothetical protein
MKHFSGEFIQSLANPIDRIECLIGFARQNGSDGIGEAVRVLFPHWEFEFYQGVRTGESPPDFIKRVYQPWHAGDAPLLVRIIQALDPTLWRAFMRWSNKHPIAEDFALPPGSKLRPLFPSRK